jgi:hypothetical protein
LGYAVTSLLNDSMSLSVSGFDRLPRCTCRILIAICLPRHVPRTTSPVAPQAIGSSSTTA